MTHVFVLTIDNGWEPGVEIHGAYTSSERAKEIAQELAEGESLDWTLGESCQAFVFVDYYGTRTSTTYGIQRVAISD